MTTLTVGFIGIGILFIFLFMGMPIGIAMGMVGFAGFAFLRGLDSALGVLITVPYRTFASYDFSVVPLFILMGAFCFHAGLSKDLYNTVYRWLGHFRGGLALATVGACAGFAAVSGSSVATAATMGTVALPEMERHNYDPALATGSVAAGGTIGILIPPSVGLIVYGIIAEQSIGRLFLAGFIPGVLEAVFYIITIFIICRINPRLGPPGPRASWVERMVALKNTWVILLLFLLVLGGIYFGVFTPTEAAGVGAFGAFIFALLRGKLNRQALKDSLFETLRNTAMILIIVLGALILGYFLAVSRLPFILADTIVGLEMNRYIILIFILAFLLFLGTVIDAPAMILLITPIFYPVAVTLGFDPIWFGIIVVRMCEMALITPPVGLNVFVIKGVAPDVPMYTIFKGIIPFLIADVCHVTLLIVFPQLSLFLPGFM
ncbi:TRAP transporter large permease [Thermodesulfobacteriota bacterium]